MPQLQIIGDRKRLMKMNEGQDEEAEMKAQGLKDEDKLSAIRSNFTRIYT